MQLPDPLCRNPLSWDVNSCWRGESKEEFNKSLIIECQDWGALDEGSCIIFHQAEALDETINLSRLELSLDQFEGVQFNCSIPHFAFSELLESAGNCQNLAAKLKSCMSSGKWIYPSHFCPVT